MSRISSIVSVSTPVSDRIKIFDKSPVSPKKIPPKSSEKPVRESATLETPKLRPVPRSQFPVKEVPASVKPYLNTKLAPTPARAEQKPEPSAVVKVELKAVKSDKSDKSDSRVATRSSSSVRSSMGQSKADGNKPGVKVGGAGGGGGGGGKKVASSPLVSKKLGSTSSQEPAKTRTSLNRSNSSARTVSRTPSLSSSSRTTPSTASTPASRTSSGVRSGQSGRADISKKQSEKVADKEVVGQVGTGLGPTVNNESPAVASTNQAGQERKLSERSGRKVSRPGGGGGGGEKVERKTSEKVETTGPLPLLVKKVSKIEKKESAVITGKNVPTLKKVSTRQDLVVKKESRVEDSVIVTEESHHANQDRKVSKVVTKNNDAIVKSDDDDNEDDIDNDSMEDDVENLSVFNANKTRKSSEPPPVMKSVEIVNKDSSEIHSQRKQSFLNPFEPPCPELVNKSKLIEEFNTVQEQNLKNNIKHLEEPLMKESLTNIEPSNKTYFTSQALNNATSSTINQALKLDIEFKDDKIAPVCSAGAGVAEELDSLSSSSEGDLRATRRPKLELLDYRVRDQEDDLDDLVSQVQMLETSKMKLEVELQQMKKEHRRELQGKEDELEDARAAAAKKLKTLEQQLEQEHEERMGFVREKHELESKIMNLQDLLDRSGDEDLVLKLKRDLKRTKALLKDAHLFLEKNQADGTNKVIMRQLKNQLEDAEFARSSAMKSKQNSELELTDVQTQLEDIIRNKNEVDEKNLRLTREKADLQSALNENEEELSEVMRKYKACVATVSTDQITIQDQSITIQTLEQERNKLREQYAELCQKLDHLEGENVSTIQHKRLELKIREMESKLELEKTTKTRMETMIQRMKEVVEKMTREMDDLRIRELSGQDEVKKMSRQLRDLREEMANVQSRELELSHKKSDLEKQLEVSEAETLTIKNELKIALRRIEDLQNAIGGEMDSEAGSDQDSDSSDEDMSSFIDNHRRSMSIQRERESLLRRRDRPFECISEEE